MADFRDAPGLAEGGDDLCRIGFVFEQSEITERSFQTVMRPWHAIGGKIACHDRAACRISNLNGERGLAFNMRLHRAGIERECITKRVLGLIGIETAQT